MHQRQQLINKFMGTLAKINLIDAASTRGVANGVLVQNIDEIVKSEGMQALAKSIAEARDRGLDRISVSEDEAAKIESELLNSDFGRQVWLSVLTTLQYAIIPQDGGGYDILW